MVFFQYEICYNVFMSYNNSCRVSRHGSQQIQLHLKYNLEPRKKVNYSVNCYLFSPAQLGINKETFKKDAFFEDYNSYTRYEISKMTLDELCKYDFHLNPLSRVEDLLNKNEYISKEIGRKILYEIRTYYNIYFRHCKNISKKALKISDKKELMELYNNFVLYYDKIRKKFAELKDSLLVLNPEKCKKYEEIQMGINWIDEGCSISSEKLFWKFYERFNFLGVKKYCRYCVEKIEELQVNRKACGYKSFSSKDNKKDNEFFLYREHTIKKWSQQIMYMTVNSSRRPKQVINLLFGGAAGLAMLFSLVLTVVTLQKFQDNKIAWIILGVIIYIMKDRIKEWGRSISLAVLPKAASDKQKIIIDHMVNKKCGKAKEWVSILSSRRLPEDIKNIRLFDKTPLDRKMLREDIMHFRKEISISSDKVLENHQRMSAIIDILRFDCHKWFYKMDKEQESVYCIDDDKLERIKAERVYHLSLIVSINSNIYEEPQLHRYRIIATRGGIRRISEVDLNL